jgi:hypothetical protein
MSKISKVPSVASKRVQNSYVNRITSVSKNNPVESVEPVERVSNQVSYFSSNYTLASDLFYSNLNELKREYKRFYHDHRKLEEAIKDIVEDDEHLLEHIKNLIEKYNMAFESLKSLDESMGMNNSKKVTDVLDYFKNPLTNIAILVDENYHMYIDENKFLDNIKNSHDPLRFLFEPVKGLIIKLYNAFRGIKYNPQNGFKEGYKDMLDKNVSGALVNEKA